jgi:hypothetical protein
VREAAHRIGPERIAQYARAYELLRALPDDDPRGWLGQANLHCAFCNAALKQAGFGASGTIPMQVQVNSTTKKNLSNASRRFRPSQ